MACTKKFLIQNRFRKQKIKFKKIVAKSAARHVYDRNVTAHSNFLFNTSGLFRTTNISQSIQKNSTELSHHERKRGVRLFLPIFPGFKIYMECLAASKTFFR